MALTLSAGLLLLAGPAAGQTPDAACAADSLYLISPENLDLDLQRQGPLGIVVSWPTLDIAQATCFSLSGTDTLGFTVTATGGFGDQVDRLLSFTTVDSGSVGGAQGIPLVFTWQNEGPGTNGNLAGILNLANNGGIWHYRRAEDRWVQDNGGLPMSWRQVNVVALDRGAGGAMAAALTKGETLDTDLVGLFLNDTGTWTQVAPDVFGGSNLITHIRMSAEDSRHFLVGTARNGLYVTRDGGQTFTQWTTQFDPDFADMPSQFNVGALDWIGDRIFVFLANFGLFASEDGGLSFTRLPVMALGDLDAANPVPVLPIVNGIAVDPGNSQRILAALSFHGTYESNDGGVTWHDLYGDLVVPVEGSTGAWVNTALSVAVDPVHPDRILMAVKQKGLYLSPDGGQTWDLVGAEVQPENLAGLTRMVLVADRSSQGTVFAQEDGHGILRSDNFGQTWSMFTPQPVLNTGVVLVSAHDGGGDLTFGTYGGGVYVPGTPLRLGETYSSGTSDFLRSLDLGLEMAFGSGPVERGDAFRLVGQTFQGWAVWRAPSHDPGNMILLGLYDRINPEDCIEGYCGDASFEIVPQCFAAKRAACFNFDTPDTVRFFDGEVYNGFSYYYAVSSFDYGNTALVTPQNNSNQMLFSPRWEDDPNSPFGGPGNRKFVQVNLAATPDTGGEEIYVFPNPLRPGAGIPGGEGRTVVFTNLPVGATVRIFTTAGDGVIDLGPEQLRGGQIYWETENSEHEPIAPGVYLYKVEMTSREDYWGRLVVIR